MALKRESNLADPDALYSAVLEAHSGLTAAESEALNARLILLLANHIGDAAVLHEAIAAARQALELGVERSREPRP
jgi:uncharacterized protein DUF2783